MREAFRDWARAEGLEAYDQRTNTGFLRHLVVREGVRTGELLCILVTGGRRADRRRESPGAARGARAWRRRSAARGQRRRGRGGQRHPDEAVVRALLVRGGDQRPAPARLGRLLPADEHRDGRRALPGRDRAGRADRRRDRLGPVLRDGLDRPCAGRLRAPRDRRRDRPRGHRAGARERARQRCRQHPVRGCRRRQGAARPDRRGPARARRGHPRPAPSRHDAQGRAPRGRAGRPPHRLRLLQPDDAGRQRAHPRGGRLLAHAPAAVRPLPAHAARRVRRALRPRVALAGPRPWSGPARRVDPSVCGISTAAGPRTTRRGRGRRPRSGAWRPRRRARARAGVCRAPRSWASGAARRRARARAASPARDRGR